MGNGQRGFAEGNCSSKSARGLGESQRERWSGRFDNMRLERQTASQRSCSQCLEVNQAASFIAGKKSPQKSEGEVPLSAAEQHGNVGSRNKKLQRVGHTGAERGGSTAGAGGAGLWVVGGRLCEVPVLGEPSAASAHVSMEKH